MNTASAEEPSITRVSDSQMELSVGDDSPSKIMLEPAVSPFPDIQVDCLFTGNIEDDDSSVVTVMGCHDSEVTTMAIASKKLKHGLLEMILVQGTLTVLNEFNDPKSEANDNEEEIQDSRLDSELNEESNNLEKAIEVKLDIDVVEIEKETYFKSRYEGKLPESTHVETTFWYDQSLLNHFNGNETETKEWLYKARLLS